MRMKYDPESRAKLLPIRFRIPTGLTCVDDAFIPASPFLHQAHFPEDARNDTITNLAYTGLKIFHCHTERKHTRILYLHPVCVNPYQNTHTAQRIIRMADGINQNFTNCQLWIFRNILPVHVFDFCSQACVTADKTRRLINGIQYTAGNIYTVNEFRFIRSPKTGTTHSCIRKIALPHIVQTKQNQPAIRHRKIPGMRDKQSQRFQLFFIDLLTCNSEDTLYFFDIQSFYR